MFTSPPVKMGWALAGEARATPPTPIAATLARLATVRRIRVVVPLR
jgi:hypothetical protein